MGIALNPKCSARLQQVITDILSRTKIRHGLFLTPETLLELYDADRILPSTGAVRDSLNDYIGETPLLEFVSDALRASLRDAYDYAADEGPVLLTSLDGYSEPAAVSTKILGDFQSLPWHYCLTVPLSPEFSALFSRHIGELRVGRTLRICTGRELASTHPRRSPIARRDRELEGLFGGLLIGRHREWEPDRA
jgi:hypothetical protein